MLVYYFGYGYFADFSEQIERDCNGHIAAGCTFQIHDGVFEVEERIIKQLEYTGTARTISLELTNHKDALPQENLKNFVAEHFKHPRFWMTNQNKDKFCLELNKDQKDYQLDAITKLSILNDAPHDNTKSPSTDDSSETQTTTAPPVQDDVGITNTIKSKGIYKQRDDIFREWFKDNEELARKSTKEQINVLLIKTESNLEPRLKIWQSGFNSWWDCQTIYKATQGRKKSSRNRMT